MGMVSTREKANIISMTWFDHFKRSYGPLNICMVWSCAGYCSDNRL